MGATCHPSFGGAGAATLPAPPDGTSLDGVDPELCPACDGPTRPHCDRIRFPKSNCRMVVCLTGEHGYGRPSEGLWVVPSASYPAEQSPSVPGPYGPDFIA